MCMPYLTKLFGGANRREQRTRNGGVTPLPSLANVPQVSADTVRTTRSAKSGKSGKSGKSASRRSSNTNTNTNANTNANANANANQSSESSLESNTDHMMVVRNTSDSVAPIVEPVDDESRTRRSWWGYLGMNRNKKPSIESL
ncbi:probable endopeptidase p60 [Drosophila elegans]|uniref:probable endopeptidase p60 n=1 Tax=Drosophila elegans TaxID=30023 RepID=UPI0007E8867D|nr:probable endopeptidase p60 [Drosophila elegans]